MIKSEKELKEFIEKVKEESFDFLDEVDEDISKFFHGQNMGNSKLVFDLNLILDSDFSFDIECREWIDEHTISLKKFNVQDREELIKRINDSGFENISFFDGPNMDFISAIIGMDENSGRIVYDYDLMIEYLMNGDNGMEYEDAIQWIDYNTLRSLPYFQNSPIVLMQNYF